MTAQTIKTTRSYWDRKAHIYAEIRQIKDWFQKIDQHVLDLIDAKSCSFVLDVGIGPAFFAIKLVKNNNAMVAGIDISKRSLRLAKTHIEKEKVSKKIFLIVASTDYLPFKENCFDAVTSIYTIHHLPPQRMENSFGEFYRVLKPQGKFALVEDWASDPRTYFQHIIYELRKILMESEIEEYHTKYYEYVSMIERRGLKIFAVEFHPRIVDLSRYASLSSAQARKLLKMAEKIDTQQHKIDTAFIGAVKPK